MDNTLRSKQNRKHKQNKKAKKKKNRERDKTSHSEGQKYRIILPTQQKQQSIAVLFNYYS